EPPKRLPKGEDFTLDGLRHRRKRLAHGHDNRMAKDTASSSALLALCTGKEWAGEIESCPGTPSSFFKQHLKFLRRLNSWGQDTSFRRWPIPANGHFPRHFWLSQQNILTGS